MTKQAASRGAKTDTRDREIIITRMLNAPRDLVWEAWTNPEHLIHWWGPNGFTNTFHEFDFRPRGVWRFMMHGPDGTDYQNRIVFDEIVKPERIVYTHSGDSHDSDEFQSTVTFEEVSPDGSGGVSKTKVTLHMVLATPELREKMVKEVGAIEGGNQTLGRLADYISKM